MGIQRLNNSVNIVSLWKTMKAGQTAKTAAPSKPVELTKNGSIFNTQNSQNTQKTQKTQTQNPEISKNSQSQNSGISVGEGQAKAAEAKGMMAQAKAGKTQADRTSSIMGKVSAQSKTIQADTQASQKAMQAAMKTGQAKIDQNNVKMQKLTADMMKEKAEIDAIQSRLEILTGGTSPSGSVYSLKLAGETDPADSSPGSIHRNTSGGGGSGNESEIESLTSQLGSKQAKITVYSGKINKIQTSTGKAIHSMSKASHRYEKTVKQNQQQIQQNQAKADASMDAMDIVNMVGTGTMVAGQMVKALGQGLRAMGEKMVESQNPATAAAGAAMITASVPIEKIGVVTEDVGAYTVTAASLTKGIIQMADGDIAGAMQSLVAATSTGMQAVQGSINMKNTFEGISQAADDAIKTGVENQAAKKLYKQNKQELKEAGFTNKQIKQMASQQTSGTMKNADVNALKAQLKANKHGAKGSNIGMTDGIIASGQTNMKAAGEALTDAKKSINEFTPNDIKNRDRKIKKDGKFMASTIADDASSKDAALDSLKSKYSDNGKGTNKTLKMSESTAKKAEKVLKSIGTTIAAAGTLVGIVMTLTQSTNTKSVEKKEHHRHKDINVDVNHSYMKELAHRKRMARAEGIQQRIGR